MILSTLTLIVNTMAIFYTGSYTHEGAPAANPTGKGIGCFQLNMDNGEVKLLHYTEQRSPSYIAISEDKKYLYAVEEMYASLDSKVFAYEISSRGKLKLLNSQKLAGDYACYLAIIHDCLVVACYVSGNALSWERTDPVTATVKAKNNTFSIVDNAGKKVAHQIIEQGNWEYKVMFVADNIPSLGYKTYYVNKSGKHVAVSKRTVAGNKYENKFYNIEFGNGGIKQILDKELGKELIDVKNFRAGEVFTMASVGTGAGEFFSMQLPDMTNFDQVSLHNPEWELAVDGPIYAKYQLEQPLKNVRVKQYITIYHNLKRIDFNVDLLNWNGTKKRELRMALPLKMADAKVTYEVPMGTVTIGEDEIEDLAGGRYVQDNKDVHPREVQNFISTNNDELGVTLSSSVAVFDHLDPTYNPSEYPVIQPVLLAARKSCKWNGNWYLQEGNHYYSFSLFSHEPGWKNAYKQAIQANNPIIPVNSKNKKGELPAEKSFFSVSQPHTLVSTVKKCDDDENVVIRLYDIKGKDTNVEVKTFFKISKAELTNIIEEEGKAIPASGDKLDLTIGHHAIETYKIVPE